MGFRMRLTNWARNTKTAETKETNIFLKSDSKKPDMSDRSVQSVNRDRSDQRAMASPSDSRVKI